MCLCLAFYFGFALFTNVSNAVCMLLLLLLNALDCFRPYFNDQSDSMNTLSELADNAFVDAI